VQLFGLDVPDTSSGPFVSGVLEFSRWQVAAGKLTAAIRCGPVHIFLEMRTEQPGRPASFERLRLSDARLPAALPEADPFLIELGGVELAFPHAPRPPAAGPPGSLDIAGPVRFPSFPSHPVELTPVGALALDFSDPNRPLLSLLPGAFHLRTQVLAVVDGRERPLFEHQYRSAARALELATPHSAVDIPFAVSAAEPLPLYGERIEDDVALGMTLGDCQLHVVLARGAGANGRPNRVLRLWAEPGPRGAALTTYGLADATNSPARWRLGGAGVDLSCRSSSQRRPATLMLAALLDAPCGEPPHGGVTLVQDGKEPLHGPVPDGTFLVDGVVAALVCDGREETLPDAFRPPADDPLVACVLTELTLPWARFPKSGARPAFRYPKPGRSYLRGAGAGADVETLSFGDAGLGLPLLHAEWLGPADASRRGALKDPLALFTAALNDQSRDLLYVPPRTTHETRFQELPAANTRLHPLRVYDFSGPAELERPDVSQYRAGLDFSLARVGVTWPDEPPEYILLQEGKNPLTEIEQLRDCLGDFALELPEAPPGQPYGVLKLSRERTLAEIWAKEPSLPTKVLDLLHPSLEHVSWTGLLLFDLPVDCRQAKKYPVLRSIVPPGVKLSYLAITPKAEDGEQRAAVCGRIQWKNLEDLDADARNDRQPREQFEVGSLARRLEVAWYDGALTYFHSETRLHFDSLLGRDNAGRKEFDIVGTFDAATSTLRFRGLFTQPQQLLDDEGFGPVKSMSVSGATIEHVDGKNSASLDGSIALKDFQTSSFELEAGQTIDFQGLRIELPDALKLAGDWLRISYPSLSIPVPLPAFEFQGFSLRLDRLAVDWSGTAASKDRWGKLFQLDAGELPDTSVALGFRVDLMKLPDLAFKSLDRLVLELWLGFGKNGAPRLGLSFADFSAGTGKIHLDLLRFLVLTVNNVRKFESADHRAQGLALEKVSLQVLEKPIVDDLELIVFSTAGRYGFLGFLPHAGSLGKELLEVHWLLVAQNLQLPSQLIGKLLEIDPVDPAAATAPCKTTQDLAMRRKTIQDKLDELARQVKSGAVQGSVTDVEEWTFAAGFTLLELLDGKALFQDGRYYGLTLDGPIFCDWFGYNLALSVLYTKGRTPAEDEFSLTVRLPRVTLPAFEFIGGIIHFWARMDGSFLVDVGFPWIEGGIRRWDRALGAIITPYQGSGGFYLRKQTVTSLKANGGHKGLMIGGGLALQFGLGGAYGSGIFRVSASIGIFIVVEGQALLCEDRLLGLQLIGSVGLLGRATGELNWWVISIRVDVLLIAEARLTFDWGQLELPADGTPCEEGSGATITFEMVVYAGVSASACIGWGPFKICQGISVSIAIPISPKIQLRLA
jgi:hypothetical protein